MYVMLLYVHVGMFLCVRTYMYVYVYVSFLSMLFINFETEMILWSTHARVRLLSTNLMHYLSL